MTHEQIMQKEREERLEYDNNQLAIQTVMARPDGKKLIKYLLKSLDFGGFPPTGLQGNDLIEYVAFLRAGNSIYKMILEAAPELTGQLITDMEKERQNAEKKLYADGSNNGEQ
jgi:hypothetical protein